MARRAVVVVFYWRGAYGCRKLFACGSSGGVLRIGHTFGTLTFPNREQTYPGGVGPKWTPFWNESGAGN